MVEFCGLADSLAAPAPGEHHDHVGRMQGVGNDEEPGHRVEDGPVDDDRKDCQERNGDEDSGRAFHGVGVFCPSKRVSCSL